MYTRRHLESLCRRTLDELKGEFRRNSRLLLSAIDAALQAPDQL